jgi:1,4-dihydroxy-2-naphthoate octaprenyltransferase
MNIRLHDILLFLRLSRPYFLLGSIVLYGLGGAILDYLGRPIDVQSFVLGQLIIIFIQLMTHYLNEYSDAELDRSNENRTLVSGGSGVLGPGMLPPRTALYAAAFSLALAASALLLLLSVHNIPILAWMILLLIFLGAFFYSLPPVNLATSGYGDVTTSVIVAAMLPAFAFSLQTGEFHRLLVMSSTPLVALHFAMMIVFQLPDYASDLKYEKRTLLIRTGWSMAMRIHDFAIVFAIGSFVVAFLLGLPWRVALGSLISFPLAIGQIWQLSRIRKGFSPNWKTLTFSGLALFGLTAYLEVIGYLVI